MTSAGSGAICGGAGLVVNGHMQNSIPSPAISVNRNGLLLRFYESPDNIRGKWSVPGLWRIAVRNRNGVASGKAAILWALVGGVAVAIGGVAGYAVFDPEARQSISARFSPAKPPSVAPRVVKKPAAVAIEDVRPDVPQVPRKKQPAKPEKPAPKRSVLLNDTPRGKIEFDLLDKQTRYDAQQLADWIDRKPGTTLRGDDPLKPELADRYPELFDQEIIAQWHIDNAHDGKVSEVLRILNIPESKWRRLKIAFGQLDARTQENVISIAERIKSVGLANLGSDEKKFVQQHRAAFGLD